MKKYSIERVVGEGSFGKALLCKRREDGRKCIVKQISLSKMSRQEAKATEQESALLARLQHPNIVCFWESFNEVARGKSNLYIVMDFADGGDLSDFIKSRRNRLMSENQVINIAVQISLAMKHVHDRKILHRDLKSGNIFLTKSGVVKLGDFGIARVLRNTGELASTQIGTPYFMSPEILQGRRYNSKTDIWSLGCVFFELSALKVPFNGSSMKQLVSNITRQSTPRISSQYSKEFCTLLYSMLAKNPKERPSINTILAQAVMRNQIASILDDGLRQKEFSHTILHGDDILKKPPVAKTPLGVIKEETPRSVNPQPSRPMPGSVHQVNQAMNDARARAKAQAQAQALQREKGVKGQQDAAARLREYEARRKMDEMKLQAAKELRRKHLAEQAARDAAIRKRREKENAEKLAALRKQEQARRQEKAALLAKQQAAEKERLARYRKAAELREKERAQAARAKALEDRKKYEQNKRAAEDVANHIVDLAPPPQPAPVRQKSEPVIKPQQQANQAVAVARGGMGFDIKGGNKRINPRMKPSIPRQDVPGSNALRIDGRGQGQYNAPPPQRHINDGKGGGRIVVVKEGFGAPSAAQLRRERFERLRAKAKSSQELLEKKKNEKSSASNKNQRDKLSAQVEKLSLDESTDSDSDVEEITFKPGQKGNPVKAENKWFSDLARQMGDLQGELNNLRELKSPKESEVPQPKHDAQLQNRKAKPPDHPPQPAKKSSSAGVKKKKQPNKTVVTPPTAQELALRKVKRVEDSKNLREFVRAQRNQMGTPSPSPPASKNSPMQKPPPDMFQKPENLSVHFSSNIPDKNNKSPKASQKSPKQSSSREMISSPKQSKSESAAEAMRRKRDAERREMKKMIAEKRNEKIQHLQNGNSIQAEVVVVDVENGKEIELNKHSPTKVKFQDFLGRDYTPVTSEEDAAVINIPQPIKTDQNSVAFSSHSEGECSRVPLMSTDDIDVNKRSKGIELSNGDGKVEKLLVSSSCGDLAIPQQHVINSKPVDASSSQSKVEEESLDIMEEDCEVVDPNVYELLAEDMGEGWGDYVPRNHVDDEVPSFNEVEDTEKDEKGDEERADQHAVEEYNNMLSAMHEALNIPERNQDSGEDDDSTFEDDEDDVEANRILGTFGQIDDIAMCEAICDVNPVVDDTDIVNEDDESLGSSWGEIDEEDARDDDDDDPDDIPPPAYVSEHDITVYGVPFPIATELRQEDGMNLSEEVSAASKMEYIREFLEGALGEEKFVQAYRLLKDVDIVDEDALLERMENIVGTDGLKHMGVFIQLIAIEEKFENV